MPIYRDETIDLENASTAIIVVRVTWIRYETLVMQLQYNKEYKEDIIRSIVIP